MSGLVVPVYCKFFLVPLFLPLVLVLFVAFAYLAHTIIKAYGYSVVQTQLHSVPPVAATLTLCLITAYISDRTGHVLQLLFSVLSY
jgi:hypothetical protein